MKLAKLLYIFHTMRSIALPNTLKASSMAGVMSLTGLSLPEYHTEPHDPFCSISMKPLTADSTLKIKKVPCRFFHDIN